MTETNQPCSEGTNWKGNTVVGLRFLQALTISLAAVGFIWGLGDFINSLIPPSSVVTPMSVLMMLYGVVASAMIEVPVRLLKRKK